MPETQNDGKSSARRIKILRAGAMIALAVVLIVASVRYFFIPLHAYQTAKDRYESSDFYQALADFTALNGFLSSENWADDCRVMLTQGSIRSGNFPEAAAFYAGIQNLERALPAELTEKIRETGDAHFAEADYVAAYDHYSVIADEQACADCVARQYDAAIAAFEETGKLPEAISLPMLAGYRDADSYAKYQKLQASSWDAENWEENVALCYELGDFLDTQEKGFIAQRLFGHTYSNGSYYFTTDAGGDWSYNLPAYRLYGYYGLYSKMDGNEMYIGSDELDSWTNQFRFVFSDNDRTLEVYCYRGGSTITLTLEESPED